MAQTFSTILQKYFIPMAIFSLGSSRLLCNVRLLYFLFDLFVEMLKKAKFSIITTVFINACLEMLQFYEFFKYFRSLPVKYNTNICQHFNLQLDFS